MTYTIILFVTRSPGITSEQFRDYYEHKHIPLLYSLVGNYWPKAFRRRYLARIHRKGFGGPANPDRPTLMLRGDMSDLDCDCVAEMSFDNEIIFQKFYTAIYTKHNAAILAQDEQNFLDTGKTKIVVVGETWTTDEKGAGTGYINFNFRTDGFESERSASGMS
ncbi:hypothetical protein IQ07DRAFT_52351 [Pyrenochaeta sp. DS3sAY3a]|nr:hypothetical protein IQ07DRAFT_52351 [Pyrenochaeta sp. DS3sAY3a]